MEINGISDIFVILQILISGGMVYVAYRVEQIKSLIYRELKDVLSRIAAIEAVCKERTCSKD